MIFHMIFHMIFLLVRRSKFINFLLCQRLSCGLLLPQSVRLSPLVARCVRQCVRVSIKVLKENPKKGYPMGHPIENIHKTFKNVKVIP